MTDTPYPAFKKIPRLSRGCVITEKIDGTNGLISIDADGTVRAGSRNRWLKHDGDKKGDNYDFAKWVYERRSELLLLLGPGLHYGEYWGQGIARNYDLTERRFSLFNSGRWKGLNGEQISGLYVVPEITAGVFTDGLVAEALASLAAGGSLASPGFDKPEGVVIFHAASRNFYKKLLEGDELPKGVVPRDEREGIPID